jgi:hypothetical protein
MSVATPLAGQAERDTSRCRGCGTLIQRSLVHPKKWVHWHTAWFDCHFRMGR